MKNKGFTLIELMIGVVLVGFVSIAAYTFYLNTFQFQVIQERQKDMRIRLQLAMDMLTSDIKAAGFGVIDPGGGGLPIAPGFIPITSGSGVAASDTITLAGRDLFVGTLAATKFKGSPVAGSITVLPSSGVGGAGLVVGNVITIGGLFSTVVTAVAGNTITILPGIPTMETYYAGMDVYTVATIMYGIGPSNVTPGNLALFRTVAGIPTLVADGIEDLQVTYHVTGKLPNGNIVPVGKLNAPRVNIPIGREPFLAVEVALAARTPDTDPNYLGGFLPPWEDRVAPGPADNFRRAFLTQVVALPNSGCERRSDTC